MPRNGPKHLHDPLRRQHDLCSPFAGTAILNPDDRVHQGAHEPQVVADQHDREALVTVQLRNKVHDGGSGSWVNAGCGLVEQEEVRLDGQGTRNQHPLLLAT